MYGRVNKTQYDELFGASALMIVTYIMIGAGGVVVLISLAGCVGAFTQSKIMLGLVIIKTSEPHHDKTKEMFVRPAKTDQPVHPPSLIRVFAVHSLGS